MEVWIGKNPSLQNICSFGCEAYAHVPKEKGSQMNNKVLKCIFIVYEIFVKGYKLLDPMDRKVFYSRNVTLKEVNSSLLFMQGEEHEKKLVVQLPLKT